MLFRIRCLVLVRVMCFWWYHSLFPILFLHFCHLILLLCLLNQLCFLPSNHFLRPLCVITEYKVIDDRKVTGSDDEDDDGAHLDDEEELGVKGLYFQKLMDRKPALAEDLKALRDALLKEAEEESGAEGESAPKAWDIKDIGYQASQSIMRSKDPLELLREISQNFPMYGTSLTRIKVNTTVKDALLHNQRIIPAGSNRLLLNGLPVDIEDMDMFEIFEQVKEEAAVLDSFSSLGLSSDTIRRLLSLPVKTPSSYEVENTRIDMETGKGIEADGVITWFNDLEDTEDMRYHQWNPSIQGLLTPGWPNQLRYVSRNLYSGVSVIDPTTRDGLGLFERALFFVKANAPVRMGFVLKWPEMVTSSEDSFPEYDGVEPLQMDQEANKAEEVDKTPKKRRARPVGEVIARCVHYLRLNDGNAVELMEDLHLRLQKGDKVTRKVVKRLCQKNSKLKGDDEGFKGALRTMMRGKEYRKHIATLKDYVLSKGLGGSDTLYVLNGVPLPTNADSFRLNMMNRVLADQRTLQGEAYSGRISDRTNFDIYWSTHPTTAPRVSEIVLEAGPDQKYLSTADGSSLVDENNFVSKPQSDTTPTISYVLAANLGSVRGIILASELLQHAAVTTPWSAAAQPQVHIVDNSMHKVIGRSSPLARFVYAAQRLADGSLAFSCLRKALVFAGTALSTGSGATEVEVVLKKLESQCGFELDTISQEEVSADSARVRSQLGISMGSATLVANHRIINLPLSLVKSEFKYELRLLEHLFIQHGSLDKIVETLSEEDEGYTPLGVARVTALLTQRAIQAAERGNPPSPLDESPLVQLSGAIAIPAEKDASPFDVVAVLDPLSHAAQRASSVLLALRSLLGCSMRVYLNPKHDQGEDLPLKRFYRFVAAPELEFDSETGARQVSEQAFFRIQSKNVLTMGVDTPESWILMSKSARYDLDNLKLADFSGGSASVVYQLEHLLIQGRGYDVMYRGPPAGLQLWLGNSIHPHIQDTVVMQNLGYFQLKASPGVWDVRLAPGISDEVFYIVDDRDDDSREKNTVPEGGANARTKSFAISTFSDKYVNLNVQRRPGQERVDLTNVERKEPSPEGNRGFWNKMKGMFAGLDSEGAGESGDAELVDDVNGKINIFSVASGHLYERFLKIMMLSVVKRTDKPVKFWFIKNFLSPQFKEFVPKMAKHYGFEVELVTFKWPRWLRRQTEKQRIIWGYKILFLDVLFPLKLKRVIFTDADQVVRGDMNELQEMDLEGKAYAYTPFCDSNKETEGFRFWKQGFWMNHLQGRPYHISALYVVDLDRFRRMRAGDTLRSVYDNLSADPNSLANLDQDLPNYTQNMVPIHSLPQEWLWCQTWCSMDTLESAKTIDLCNNPLTKAPKLDVAKSLLPEWVELDEEAKNTEELIRAAEESGEAEEVVEEVKSKHVHSEL